MYYGNGIPSFPMDVTPDADLELLEAEIGLEGFGILVYVLRKIYQNGYYMEAKEDNILLFARHIGSTRERVSEVIGSAIKRKFFSAEHYEKYAILTSRGIQKRWIQATRKRILVEIEKRFCLAQDVVRKYKHAAVIEVPDSNSIEIVKNSKVNKDAQNPVPAPAVTEDEQFNKLWDLYDKKKDKGRSLEYWFGKKKTISGKKISDQDKVSIMSHVPEYVKSTPDKSKRKDLKTYLYNECWNDEIIISREQANEMAKKREEEALKKKIANQNKINELKKQQLDEEYFKMMRLKLKTFHDFETLAEFCKYMKEQNDSDIPYKKIMMLPDEINALFYDYWYKKDSDHNDLENMFQEYKKTII